MNISIIIATFNAAQYIGRCLDSIREQDYPDFEVVVADGGSRDGTLEILKHYSTLMGGSLIWFSEPDQGIGDAWNKAVKRANGEWLLFQGADDRLAAPDVISKAASFLLKAYPAYRVVYGRVAMSSSNGEILELIDRPWSINEFHSHCLLTPPHQAVFNHRSLFDEHGYFDTTLTYLMDYDFLLRGMLQAQPLHMPEFTVSNMQVGGISNSRDHIVRLNLELMYLYKRHAKISNPILYWWLVKAFGIMLLYQLGGERFALEITNLYRRLIGRRPPLAY